MSRGMKHLKSICQIHPCIVTLDALTQFLECILIDNCLMTVDISAISFQTLFFPTEFSINIPYQFLNILIIRDTQFGVFIV